MKKTIKGISLILALVCWIAFDKILPDDISIYNSITAAQHNKSKKEIKIYSDNITEAFEKNFTLLNIIPTKEINPHDQSKKFVIPCGTLFGIKFHTKGVTVISCCDISYNGKIINPGEKCGLKAGDSILSVNNQPIADCGELQRLISQSSGSELRILFDRQGKKLERILSPVQINGEYKVGLWVRDSCAGLGTMTFYDPNSNYFAALGHGICDSDTGEIMPLGSADITSAQIGSITKGTNGIPGSINGYFDGGNAIGHAVVNNELGLYGLLYGEVPNFEPVEIANIKDVQKGKAQILCSLDGGSPKYYNIEITNVNYDPQNKTKNLQITASDTELLEKTGGIVQGMSGSPILQNGKLVGAVTHVFMTNPTKGYGIFAQNMYDEIAKRQN